MNSQINKMINEEKESVDPHTFRGDNHFAEFGAGQIAHGKWYIED